MAVFGAALSSTANTSLPGQAEGEDERYYIHEVMI
jgi:hypothetical protein